ncbi:TetR/AcrR family transcriptional regulator [Promicromonospora citrea]|uniref:TetR family transcriptional regulator n=1 Tax=Promicromonospora citrea TaxID=43677 RepID=A0A8H9GFD5_9MICO|nr:TetR/AcrR family transcriptional regulator [Promicromonospora citrea]NNH53538.1 TetR/AcrR family transcriptional regulator [Promicromonospora citrea]GGM18131.1 TetR family transcriptional regulator [Promicromonospora citrea]
MSEQGVSARRGRGRRPAGEVRAAVLAATGRLLLEEGLPAVTFDRVAREAGSSKVTLYKWWPSPGALAAEAYFARSAPVLAFPDTGDLRADLVSQLTAFVRLMTRDGAGVPVSQIVGAAQTDPHVAAAWVEGYARPRRDLGLERLRTAQRKGQLRADADLHLLVDQLWGVCYHRLLVLREPFDETLVPRLVDQALRGAAPQG